MTERGCVPRSCLEGVKADESCYTHMTERGCVPRSCLEGGKADESCWTRVTEHGCVPWRWLGGVEAGWRIDVQDRCGAVHSSLVAVAATTSGDDESALCYVWPWSQDYEEPVKTLEAAVSWAWPWRMFDPASVDAVVWRVRLWTKMHPRCVAVNGRCGQAIRCDRRPAPSYVGVQSLCCDRRPTSNV